MKITHITDLKGLPYPYQLQGVDLRAAYLAWADLRGAILRGADLRCADLRGAIPTGADLRCADIECTDLSGADLKFANLDGAFFKDANLTQANLQGASLFGANLRDANLTGAKFPEFLVKLPPLGQSFIAWKKVRDSSYYDIVLKLEIPADSPRVSTFISRKCRAKSAKVLEAFTVSRKAVVRTDFRSLRDSRFIYRVGETVEVSDFNDDIRVECTQGIHFFETRGEAEEYIW